MASYTLVRKGWSDLLRFPFDQLRLTARCARLTRSIGADLLYANASRNFIWSTLGARISRRPIVWHIHNLLGDNNTLALLQRIGQWPTVRQIIAVSAVAAAQFPQLAHKTTVIPPGVDITTFQPDLSARATTRSELELPTDAFVVGIVGDLIPLKGQHTLLQAVRSGSPQIRAVLVGDTRPGYAESLSYTQHLHEMAGETALFTGWRDDLPAILNSLDLLVIASERETGPLVLLEALACGLPVISTSVGRAPELLPSDALFPVGDAEALGQRLQYWRSNREGRVHAGRVARGLAESELSKGAFQARMRQVLDRILEDQ